jgi:23S rRNA pseudouridine1911/1915/1917 synthase
VLSIAVPLGDEPARLDLFLARHLPRCSRRTAQRAIAAGEVRVNGRRARKGDLVKSNDVVEVPEDLFAPPALPPNPQLVIPILFEDSALIAVDKPAGMPSHALRAQETGTVANFLLAHDPAVAAAGATDREAGVVHRLDTDTSGVLLAARTADAYRSLRQQFSKREVIKEYLALVEGDMPASGVVRAPMMHDPRNRRRMTTSAAFGQDRRAREAVTYFRPLERFQHATLLVVQIPTGVMHQIRVHLASVGHPVIGDRLYGRLAAQATRQLLHASRLSFVHPETGHSLEISSPTPTDFTAVLDSLRAAGSGAAGRRRRQPSKRRQSLDTRPKTGHYPG